jgi:hypothetical protein
MTEKVAKKPRLKLIGRDGNAFAILGAAREAAKKAKMSQEQIDAIMKDAKSGNYNHLLCVMMDNFDVH